MEKENCIVVVCDDKKREMEVYIYNIMNFHYSLQWNRMLYQNNTLGTRFSSVHWSLKSSSFSISILLNKNFCLLLFLSSFPSHHLIVPVTKTHRLNEWKANRLTKTLLKRFTFTMNIISIYLKMEWSSNLNKTKKKNDFWECVHCT